MVPKVCLTWWVGIISSLTVITSINQIHSPAFANDTNELTIRFTSFNTYLNRDNEGQLITDLSQPGNSQARAVAEIIQRLNPDVILLKEFDYDSDGRAIHLFQQNYLAIGQNGANPIHFPYIYIAPTNTGIPSGLDLDNDGQVDSTAGDRSYGGDAFGFGLFPGQYGMVLLSRYPIIYNQIRTFQNFHWADMPGALLPDNLDTPEPSDWFSSEELQAIPLSSKNHWDVPIEVNGVVIHVLAAHPTPPVFDGPEDRNGNRNFDELRLWRDYITPGQSAYIYDDRGNYGGLHPDSYFLIMGDLNADPQDGNARSGAINQLLSSPLINTCLTPVSRGGAVDGHNNNHLGPHEADTSDFGDYGNYRLDYVLPSHNLTITHAFVFWPIPNDVLYRLVGTGDPVISSDHRAVTVDIEIPLINSGDSVRKSCNY